MQTIKIQYLDDSIPKLTYIGGKSDWIVLILEEHLNRDRLYELIPLMYAIRKVGFKHIQIGRNLGNLDTARSVTGTYRLYDFEKSELQGLYDELYRPMNMKMPRQVPQKR